MKPEEARAIRSQGVNTETVSIEPASYSGAAARTRWALKTFTLNLQLLALFHAFERLDRMVGAPHMNRVRLFFWMACALMSVSVHAQTGIYGAFTGAGLGSGSSGNLYGGTVGLYSDPWHGPLVSAGFDIRGEFLNGNGQSLDSGLVGLRVAVRPPVFPLKPYVEALGGVGRASTANASSVNAQYRIAGGIDWTIFPRIDWRVVEFSGGEISGGASPKVLSTGLVLRLP